jgi:hypothetical protein
MNEPQKQKYKQGRPNQGYTDPKTVNFDPQVSAAVQAWGLAQRPAQSFSDIERKAMEEFAAKYGIPLPRWDYIQPPEK